MSLHRHNFFIESDDVELLRALAAQKGMSMAALVRIAIQELLAKGSRPA